MREYPNVARDVILREIQKQVNNTKTHMTRRKQFSKFLPYAAKSFATKHFIGEAAVLGLCSLIGYSCEKSNLCLLSMSKCSL